MKHPKTKKTSNLWTIVAVLVLAILLVLSYKFNTLLTPTITASATLDASCDLRKGACTSDLPTGGKVRFSIAPQTIPILHPLQLNVETQGIAVSNVSVDFIGIGMDMGYNRPKLSAVDKTHFLGKAILPVCVRSKMEWEARVLLQTENGLIMAPFHFMTFK